jgi:4-alpha-glucanotransferase
VQAQWSPEIALAVERYVPRSPAKILLLAMEDVLGQREQVNVPGTGDELPNRGHKLAHLLEDWTGEAAVRALLDAVRAER